MLVFSFFFSLVLQSKKNFCLKTSIFMVWFGEIRQVVTSFSWAFFRRLARLPKPRDNVRLLPKFQWQLHEHIEFIAGVRYFSEVELQQPVFVSLLTFWNAINSFVDKVRKMFLFWNRGQCVVFCSVLTLAHDIDSR